MKRIIIFTIINNKQWCGYQLTTETKRLCHSSEQHWDRGWECIGGMYGKWFGVHCHGNHISERTFCVYFFNFLATKMWEHLMKTCIAGTACTSLPVITISLLSQSEKQQYNYHWFAVDVFFICNLLFCAEQMSICTATRCWWSVTRGLTAEYYQLFFLCRQGRQWCAAKQSMKFASFPLPYRDGNNEIILKAS